MKKEDNDDDKKQQQQRESSNDDSKNNNNNTDRTVDLVLERVVFGQDDKDHDRDFLPSETELRRTEGGIQIRGPGAISVNPPSSVVATTAAYNASIEHNNSNLDDEEDPYKADGTTTGTTMIELEATLVPTATTTTTNHSTDVVVTTSALYPSCVQIAEPIDVSELVRRIQHETNQRHRNRNRLIGSSAIFIIIALSIILVGTTSKLRKDEDLEDLEAQPNEANVQEKVLNEPLCFQTPTELRSAIELYCQDEASKKNITSIYGSPINNWCVSKISNFSYLFANMSQFNDSINNWDTSSAIDMTGMFYNTSNFNQPLYNWNTSSVQDMSNMFQHAHAFNQDLRTWDTSNVSKMSHMFLNASSFNQSKIALWNISSVRDMSMMFTNASSFNISLCPWIEIITSSSTSETEVIFNDMFKNTNCIKTDDPNFVVDDNKKALRSLSVSEEEKSDDGADEEDEEEFFCHICDD